MVEDRQRLLDLGVDHNTIELSGAVIPRDVNGPQSLEEIIGRYMDAILFGTEPMRVSERMERAISSQDARGGRGLRNRLLSEIHQYDGLPFHELQKAIGERVVNKFKEEIAKGLGNNQAQRDEFLTIFDLKGFAEYLKLGVGEEIEEFSPIEDLKYLSGFLAEILANADSLSSEAMLLILIFQVCTRYNLDSLSRQIGAKVVHLVMLSMAHIKAGRCRG